MCRAGPLMSLLDHRLWSCYRPPSVHNTHLKYQQKQAVKNKTSTGNIYTGIIVSRTVEIKQNNYQWHILESNIFIQNIGFIWVIKFYRADSRGVLLKMWSGLGMTLLFLFQHSKWFIIWNQYHTVLFLLCCLTERKSVR